MTKHWYAVYTKPQQEQKVAAALAKKGIETYCPLTRVGVYKGFGKKINLQPVFPSFVFVHISEAAFSMVRQVNDVINFMFWLGKPAIMPSAELKSIQHFIALHPNVKVARVAIVKNPAASPVHESSEDTANNISAIQKTIIKLSLPSLGYILTAETVRAAGVAHYTYETNRVL